MNDRMREWIDDVKENWDDPYWRLDHPEVTMLVLAIVSGIIGLAFAVLQAVILRRLQTDG